MSCWSYLTFEDKLNMDLNSDLEYPFLDLVAHPPHTMPILQPGCLSPGSLETEESELKAARQAPS